MVLIGFAMIFLSANLLTPFNPFSENHSRKNVSDTKSANFKLPFDRVFCFVEIVVVDFLNNGNGLFFIARPLLY